MQSLICGVIATWIFMSFRPFLFTCTKVHLILNNKFWECNINFGSLISSKFIIRCKRNLFVCLFYFLYRRKFVGRYKK